MAGVRTQATSSCCVTIPKPFFILRCFHTFSIEMLFKAVDLWVKLQMSEDLGENWGSFSIWVLLYSIFSNPDTATLWLVCSPIQIFSILTFALTTSTLLFCGCCFFCCFFCASKQVYASSWKDGSFFSCHATHPNCFATPRQAFNTWLGCGLLIPGKSKLHIALSLLSWRSCPF